MRDKDKPWFNSKIRKTAKEKVYWKIMKMISKSEKVLKIAPSPLTNVSDIQSLSNTVNEDDKKCIILNEYFRSISNI